MEIKTTQQNGTVEVQLIGRLDTPAALDAAKELEPLQEKADGTIILDCKELTYISSSGLRIFLTLRKAAMNKGGEVVVRSINEDIRNVFMMTGFLNLFQIED